MPNTLPPTIGYELTYLGETNAPKKLEDAKDEYEFALGVLNGGRPFSFDQYEEALVKSVNAADTAAGWKAEALHNIEVEDHPELGHTSQLLVDLLGRGLLCVAE